ncbi:fumarylacetoacetate hydrolase family protein [Rhodococcus sp. NPDC056960]|uniref:fumarylacetoacetate hydrolase family protein n=1 Tax=Rhodococcus sp. NPDC056960 TaxID=3345982 RepID=UPI00362FCF30
MRFVNIDGRAGILVGSGVIDVHTATEGAFGPDITSCLERWDAFVDAVRSAPPTAPRPVDAAELGAPVPRPRQIFAIGLNYADHARETGTATPEYPVVFTKFASSLTGPVTTVTLSSDTVDYEAELVVVIGRTARNVSEADARDHIAGLTVGQDISDRNIQTRGGAGAQWSLGKSLPGYSPIGPALVTLDEISHPDDLAITGRAGDEVLQDSRTSELIFTVPQLVAFLSSNVTLYPGDLIFTGTPSGVGIGRDPKRYLRSGETLVTEIEGLGRLETTFVDA